MKPNFYNRKISALKKERDKLDAVWHSMMKSVHNNDTGCKTHDECLRIEHNRLMNDASNESEKISNRIDDLSIESINTFPAYTACTIDMISHHTGIRVVDIENMLFRHIDMESFVDSYNVVRFLNCLSSDHAKVVDTRYSSRKRVKAITLPNWRFVESGITEETYVERIE